MNGSAESAPSVELVVDTQRFPLDPTRVHTLGRSSSCDIRLRHPEISRRHAEVSFDPSTGWTLRDLGSTNGSYQAGHRVQEAPLQPHVTITLGVAADAPALRLAVPTRIATGTSSPPLPPSPPTGAITVASTHQRAPVTIGRSSGNTVVVDDLLISRHHARITPEGDGFRIEDLRSLNGTYLNGAAVRSAHLGPHDRLTIGHQELHVVDGELHMRPLPTEVSLVADKLQVVLPQGKTLLSGVSFELPESSLLAVIGPSGAGKSTLLNALTGARRATSGSVLFNGQDLYDDYDELRHRIGVVPQDDVVHHQLTVQQALGYASELRFPADLDATARNARIEQVIDELGLRDHVNTRIDKLSGGQRKRTSVTLELLSEPSLLFLDEPTSGLDPALDRSVMQTLRALANGGRTVVVTTHNVTNLHLCDRVLLLAPGGHVAYFGPPAQLLPHFDAKDYSDVFAYVTANPQEAATKFSAYTQATALHQTRSQARSAEPAAPPLRRQPMHRQAHTLFRRHLRVLAADRSYAIFVALLPVVLAVLVMTVPGTAGFGRPNNPKSGEAMQLLVVLIVGAAFMGMAASARDLIGERAIYRREKSVGLSASAYLGAKLAVFGLLATTQSLVLVGLVLAVKEPPDQASLLGWQPLELYLAVAATTLVSAILGMVISATVSTSEQVMPLLVVAIMAQLVLCGGMIPITGRPVLSQLSWLAPSRWGFAAGASTVDVLTKVAEQTDDLWKHTSQAWLFALLMLLGLGLVGIIATALRLRKVGPER